MIINRVSRFEYRLEDFGEFRDVLNNFLSFIVKEQPDVPIHEEYLLRTITYAIGSYVLSKEVNYDPISENIKIFVENDKLKEFIPTYSDSIIVYVSKMVFNNPVTEEKEEKKAFGFYTLS